MSEKIETWKRLSSKQIADCRVFKVREDLSENGEKKSSFFVIENPDWVNIIAITKEKDIVLIEQYRQGTEEITLELPGGMIDDEEFPEHAARRELAEETGFSAEKFIFLGKSRPNPAIQNNWIYHFAAVNAEKTHETSFDEHESVATKLVSFDEIPELIANGKITHSLVISAFYYLNLR